MHRPIQVALIIISIFSNYLPGWSFHNVNNPKTASINHEGFSTTAANYSVHLPFVIGSSNPYPTGNVPEINVPYFNGNIQPAQTAIFWFGQITPTDNYADVRLGHNKENLWVRVSIFDRRLWYDPQPSLVDMTQWDSVSIYLDLDDQGGSIDSGNVYRLDAQLNWWESLRTAFQAAYIGTSFGWVESTLPFTTHTQWWGLPQPNDNKDDRAWTVTFTIPFQSLGLAGIPPQGSTWRLGVQVHDRDDQVGTPIPDQVWPLSMDPDLPGTWGRLNFGLPEFIPAQSTATQTISLRNGMNGITVLDGVVGGNTTCGSGLDYWTGWGNHSYPGVRDVNIQNQGNTDDWPCFAKYYITFPLNSLPSGKVIISASLSLHQSGNSTGFPSDPPQALNSLIQVSRVTEDWDVTQLSWNNGPLPIENVSQAWVGSITMAELGITRVWNVSRVVAESYADGEPVRLVLYSADFYGPHGKYFFSSSSNDYAGAYRPQLDIVLGDP